MTYAPGWDCDMHCVRSSAHLRLRTRAHKLVFTPRIVIETNSPGTCGIIPACAENTGHKQGERHPRGGRNAADTDFNPRSP